LPKYRGRVPINWAILKGETETGATLHEMVAKPDAGRIVDQQSVPIGPDDIAIEVFHKVTVAAANVLARSLPGLVAGTAVLKAQDLSRGSYFGGRKPEDGRIDWSQGARAIHDLVRAVAPPYPGAFTTAGGNRLRVLRTRLEPGRTVRPGGPGLYCDGSAYYADCADNEVLRLLESEGAPAPAALGDNKISFED
jgi:methionyl-tRNA formyltransferase